MPCGSYIFKIYQKHLFLCGKTEEFQIAVLAFFKQQVKLTFQNLLKNRKLLPVEKFGNIWAFDKESKRKLLSLISADIYIKNNLLIYVYNFRV